MSTTETQAVPAGTWALDPVHSTIGFAVGYMAGTFTGAFGFSRPFGSRVPPFHGGAR
jgi:polyisoprenoid-binding protein YceI